MSDWSPQYYKDLNPFVADPDPNVTDPEAPGLTFNTSEKFKHSTHSLMLFCVAGTSCTVTTYVKIALPDGAAGATNGWIAMRTGDVIAPGTALVFPVPANAQVHCRVTARAGVPEAFYAGVLSA